MRRHLHFSRPASASLRNMPSVFPDCTTCAKDDSYSSQPLYNLPYFQLSFNRCTPRCTMLQHVDHRRCGRRLRTASNKPSVCGAFISVGDCDPPLKRASCSFYPTAYRSGVFPTEIKRARSPLQRARCRQPRANHWNHCADNLYCAVTASPSTCAS